MAHPGDDLNGQVAQAPSVAATITISLTIENTYEDGFTVVTDVTDAVIAAPPPVDDHDAHHDWAYEHIFPFTGTGWTAGDAWYDVTVTACTDPTLVGQTYDFGY